MSDVTPIPEGFNSVSAYLVVPNCVEALAFYEKALGATDIMRMEGPGGSTMHAEFQLGNSRVMMSEENPNWDCKSPKALGGTAVSLHIYCDDADAAFNQAIEAGCTVTMPLMDMFWGDRFGKFTDPFGHAWSVATRTEIVSEEEMAKRQEDFMKQMQEGCCGE